MNIFIASGNLGNDIDVRYTPAGKCVGSFSLPVKQGYGEFEKTSWVTCKILGDRAEKLSQYLTKGSKVTAFGEFVLEEWEKDGAKHSRPVIIVREVDFGGSKQGGGQAKKDAPAAPQNFDNFEDDIPF